jgi:hypothetical protein
VTARRIRPILIGAAVVAALIVALIATSVRTRPVRRSVIAFTELLAAANLQDLPRARGLCSRRYLAGHPLRASEEGGIVGLPRNMHPNFQAWREGPHVWICPTNRVGPIYQFVLEGDAWKFDGPVGLLRGRGQIILDLDPELARPEGSE